MAVGDDVKTVAEVADKAAAVVSPKPVEKVGDTLTFSTGVVVRTSRVSSAAFGDLEDRFQLPPVPKVLDENRGREIENPLDPIYKKKVSEVESRKAIAALDLAIVLGTTLVSKPDTLFDSNSEEWKDKLKALGYGKEIINSATSRYLLWMKYIAAVEQEDWENLSMSVMRKMGVPESDVNDALRSFPNNPT